MKNISSKTKHPFGAYLHFNRLEFCLQWSNNGLNRRHLVVFLGRMNSSKSGFCSILCR
ncbi:hypothetical protein HanIR_Chr13g0619061 [Helianthus annuus]|nr:hypothetical protein HanIR_Chr13g0619061 [Helianthus annuus]